MKHNNTRDAGNPLQLSKGVGPDLMLGKAMLEVKPQKAK
jgi:hypothetical protein